MEMFWKNKDWELTDRHLVSLAKAPFQRQLPKVTLSPGITMIRGPRQIGKSTWLKLLLKEELSKGHKVFYYSCEDLEDFKDLKSLIDAHPDVDYFFLDEITFVKEWWRTIKKVTDSELEKRFILTGSNSYDLKKGMDLMPGRWAQGGGELYLLPMEFDEWCLMREEAGYKTLTRLERLKLYMRVGGFPSALAESGDSGKTPQSSIETYRRWIEGDVIKMNRQPQFMRELLGQLAKLTCSTISLQTLAQKTQLMSYHTAQDYISILEGSFALQTLFAYNPESDSFQMKKEKKFYFTDPLIYWVALHWSGMTVPQNFEEQLAETLAHEYLKRRAPRLGYYSNQSGEVDFINQREWAIEVKWQSTPSNLSKAYKNLSIHHKKVWSYETLLSGI